jgi:hypothetical protein
MSNRFEIVAGRLAGQKQPIHVSQTAAHTTLSAPESPFIFRIVTDRERERERERESGIAHVI